MGREIRRVPPNYQHPKDANGQYKPMFSEDYETAMAEWINNHQLWLRGEHPDQLEGISEVKYFAQSEGNPPDVEYYSPKWADGEATWLQLYETVSEGTPVSPPFATEDELIEYLVVNGDSWVQGNGYSRESAEAMVRGGWAPSMIMIGGKMYVGAEGLVAASKERNQ